MLSNASLSDLFFNHQHDNYDALFGGEEPPTCEEMEQALRKDANDFAEQFPEFGKDGKWYFEDFFNRV